jgi:very-short-patch-repair endonuclease
LKKGVGGFKMLDYNKDLKKYSKDLRTNMTNCEIYLWSRLKSKQLNNLQFYRQKIIGNYIVDFYCPKAKLIIELDGGQHYTNEGQKRDNIRDDFMNNLGLKILRFSDKEVMSNINGVLFKIIEIIEENPPTPFFKGGFREMKQAYPLFQRGI